MILNPVPFIFIAFTTVIGAIFGATLIGLGVGLGFVVLAAFLSAYSE